MIPRVECCMEVDSLFSAIGVRIKEFLLICAPNKGVEDLIGRILFD